MFFTPPKVIHTEIFSTIPNALLKPDPDNEWTRTQPLGSPKESLIEGPSFDKSGNLYCVDVINGKILKFTQLGECSVVVEYDGWPNGLKLHRDGRIFIADYKNGIMVLDPTTKVIRPLLERYQAERFKGVNDLFFAKNGDLYFTDQGLTGLQDPTGRLFRLKTNGQLQCLLSNIPSPNGLVMNLDESAIFIAVTRDNAVWRVPLMLDGSISKVGKFIQLSGGVGPDGLALDAQGRLLIAHVGMGCVWVVSEIGEPIYRINSCKGKYITNLAFGGEGNKKLFITESHGGHILTADLEIPGKSMYSHQ
jgi:gluconolactonase